MTVKSVTDPFTRTPVTFVPGANTGSKVSWNSSRTSGSITTRSFEGSRSISMSRCLSPILKFSIRVRPQSPGRAGLNTNVPPPSSVESPSRPRTSGSTVPAVPKPWCGTDSCGHVCLIPESSSVTCPSERLYTCCTVLIKLAYP